MKKLIFSLAVGVLSLLSANAATISVTNLDGSNFSGIVNSSGAVVTSGVVAIGTFNLEPTSAGGVLGSFIQAGNTLSLGPNSFFQGNVNTGTLVSGDSFVGKNVYVVIGNGVTLANSTEILVWKATANTAGNLFVADNPVGGPDTLTVVANKGTLSVGNSSTFDFGGGAQLVFQLVAVPEPSVALLGALGGLALLRRRRN